jgi:hypothetical protein
MGRWSLGRNWQNRREKQESGLVYRISKVKNCKNNPKLIQGEKEASYDD